jgi:hypothetical protein
MQLVRRWAAVWALVLVTGLATGCATPLSVVMFAIEQGTAGADGEVTCLTPGCAATAIAQHAYDKATEGDATPCRKLNSVARALSGRCGDYTPGSLLAKDVAAAGLPRCPLSLAARDPRFWPVLPELLSKGAQPEACEQPPLVSLAQALPCPDFAAASPASLQSLRWLAEADHRAVHHDTVRMLSCPSARDVGLTGVLDGWLAQGLLPARGLGFGTLGALHPDMLGSPLSLALEARGHSAAAGLRGYDGVQPAGFDAALRSGHRVALDWWLDRIPALANKVPPLRADQLPWTPLAQVIRPGYLDDPDRQRAVVSYLMARGADPWRPLPHEPRQSTVSLARLLKSPALAELDPPLNWPSPPGERAAALLPGDLGKAAPAAVPPARLR